MKTNLAISSPENKEFNLDFTPENFQYLLGECLRLKRQRTEDLITINKKSSDLIAIKNELIDLYLDKAPNNVPEVLKSFNRDLMSTVLDYQRKELDGLRASNPVMYVSK